MKYEYIALIILVFCLILAFINFFRYENKIAKLKESLAKATSMLNLNFDSDMSFLLHLIEYKCTIYINLTLKPLSSIKDNKFLTDDDLNNAVEEIVPSILDCMSDSYKNTLYKYYSEEGFRVYLVETILNTLAVFISKDNTMKMKSMNRTHFNTESENKETFIGTKADID